MPDREWYSHIKKHGRYRSGFKKNIAGQLEEAAIKFWHESIKIEYRLGEKTFNYIPDFGVHLKSGERAFIEAKGWVDRAAAHKMGAVTTSTL